jgi:hypothetical protein
VRPGLTEIPICERTGTSDFKEAQSLLAKRIDALRAIYLFGEQREWVFREAATRFLIENTHKRSLERDARALAALDPFIGDLPGRRVHHDTLQAFVRVHDLKHTFGHRLRAVGVGFKDRKVLLGHKSGARDDALLGTRNRVADRGGGTCLRTAVRQKSRTFAGSASE